LKYLSKESLENLKESILARVSSCLTFLREDKTKRKISKILHDFLEDGADVSGGDKACYCFVEGIRKNLDEIDYTKWFNIEANRLLNLPFKLLPESGYKYWVFPLTVKITRKSVNP
jgi:hypothetical protein